MPSPSYANREKGSGEKGRTTVYVGNVWDRAKSSSTHAFRLLTNILSYPLPNMCRKAYVLVRMTYYKEIVGLVS